MNWYFLTILVLSLIGLITELTKKKSKASQKLAATIGYIVFMVLIALAVRSGW
jgi:uncharacterized membrane protein